MTRWYCLAALVLLGAGDTALAQAPRVALLHGSWDNFRHRDDYDRRLAELRWPMDKVVNREFGALVPRLDQYDLILGTALFNYEDNVQDFSAWGPELLAWLAGGGALVLTDLNYPAHLGWLAGLGPDWAVSHAPCAPEHGATPWFERHHALFAAAHAVEGLPNTWTHLQAGPAWQVLARCGDDQPRVLFRTVGRGFVALFSYQPLDTAQLQNLWTTLQYTRAGALPTFDDLGALHLGANQLEQEWRNLTDQPLTVRSQLVLTGPAAERQELTEELALPAGATGVLRHRPQLTQRGRFAVDLAASLPGGAALPALHAELVIPALIEIAVTAPGYRAQIVQAAPPAQVAARVSLHPYQERLDGLAWRARLRRGEVVLSTTEPRALTDREFEVSLPFVARGAGDTQLDLELVPAAGGRPRYARTVTLPLLARRPPQVAIDGQQNLRVDGRPFFPIALYHVATQDFARVRALGFNSIQAWGNSLEQARENLDAAAAADLLVVLEGTTRVADAGNLAAIRPALEAFGDHPALLAWYLLDEPVGAAKVVWCREVYEYLRDHEPHHPVYLVSYIPDEFAMYGEVTDILGIDPYPIPHEPVSMVSDWMRTAQQSAVGRRPVWLIPQLHNTAAYGTNPDRGRAPTAAELRNMVYQGLVWGAKGIFYYPWDDNVTGIIHEPQLMAIIAGLNAELAELGPELLARRWELTADTPADQPGFYAATYHGSQDSYVIAVNTGDTAQRFEVPLPAGAAGAVEVLYEGRTVARGAASLSDDFAPLGVHVYHLTGGAAGR